MVIGETDVGQRLIEAGDCTTVHVLVLPVATVYAHDRCLVAVRA